MENSEELRRVIERFFDAVRDGDEQAVTNRYPDSRVRRARIRTSGGARGRAGALIWRCECTRIRAATSGAADDVYALTEA
jgi:hypothetical protein